MTEPGLVTPPGVELIDDLSVDRVAGFIAAALAGEGPRAAAIPGGSTPAPYLAALATRDLHWASLAIHLTDDRIVPHDHAASNFGMVQRLLGSTGAAIAELREGAEPPAFDLVWLGMGADGHIASLFPDSTPALADGMAIRRITPDPLPPEAPFDRLTMTLAALVRTRQMMLVIKGTDKIAVLDDALAGRNDLPIARLLKAASCPVTIFRGAA
ncbi:MAG: 6-phosphogluconolactonase [Blastomonas sp.]